MGPRVVTPLSISATPRHPAPLLGLQGPAASGCLHACATSSTDQGAYGLVGGEELIDAGTWPKASVAEPLRDQLLQLCRQRLDAFREQRGEEVGGCLLTQKPAASGTGAATARRSAARSNTGCSPAPKAAANAAAPAVAWQTPHQRALEVDQIVPRDRAARTTSATCRPSASAAMPVSDGRREAGCGFCALEASGRVLLENALGAVHRRFLSGDAWPQPGDLAAAWGGWVGVAPAGMERAGGAASPHCP